MRRLRLLALAAATVGTAAQASEATTTPGVLFVSKLVITNEKVLIRREKFMTKTGIPHYPRGTEVRYDVRNRGTRPFGLNVLGSTTGRLAPGRQTSMIVFWGRRGKFVFQVRPNGPTLRVWVV
jgi:hypothetical protein